MLNNLNSVFQYSMIVMTCLYITLGFVFSPVCLNVLTYFTCIAAWVLKICALVYSLGHLESLSPRRVITQLFNNFHRPVTVSCLAVEQMNHRRGRRKVEISLSAHFYFAISKKRCVWHVTIFTTNHHPQPLSFQMLI